MRSTQRFLSLFRRFHRTRDVMDPVLPLQRVRRLHQRGTRQPTRRVLRPQRSLLPSLAVADGERGVEIRPRAYPCAHLEPAPTACARTRVRAARATAPSASARKLASASTSSKSARASSSMVGKARGWNVLARRARVEARRRARASDMTRDDDECGPDTRRRREGRDARR